MPGCELIDRLHSLWAAATCKLDYTDGGPPAGLGDGLLMWLQFMLLLCATGCWLHGIHAELLREWAGMGCVEFFMKWADSNSFFKLASW
ncbi:hypothetical protein Dimus_026514, partial [Dionaea muscipula]